MSASADPREGRALTRFARGGSYLGRGWRFVFSNPRLLPYCLLPLLIAALLFVALVCLLIFHYGDLVNLFWARPASFFVRIFWYLFYVFIFLVVMLLSYAAFFVLQALLASPFNDLLSERVEELAAGRPPTPFSLERLASSVGRTLLHQAAKLGLYLSIMLPLLLLSLIIPVLGPLLLLFGGSTVTAFFLAWDTLEYAMDRRAWDLRRKWQLLGSNRALLLGLGGLLEAALLVPVLGLICLPVGAVGGTLLFIDLERAVAPKAESTPAPTPTPTLE
jgi:CysZ protein